MKLDDTQTNKWYRIVIPGIIFFGFWFFLKPHLPMHGYVVNERRCSFEKKVNDQMLKGLLILKYDDKKARDLRTLKVLVGKDTINSEMFYYEATDFYEYLEPGDSLIKDKGSLQIKLIRDGKRKVHHLYYACEKENQ